MPRHSDGNLDSNGQAKVKGRERKDSLRIDGNRVVDDNSDVEPVRRQRIESLLADRLGSMAILNDGESTVRADSPVQAGTGVDRPRRESTSSRIFSSPHPYGEYMNELEKALDPGSTIGGHGRDEHPSFAAAFPVFGEVPIADPTLEEPASGDYESRLREVSSWRDDVARNADNTQLRGGATEKRRPTSGYEADVDRSGFVSDVQEPSRWSTADANSPSKRGKDVVKMVSSFFVP